MTPLAHLARRAALAFALTQAACAGAAPADPPAPLASAAAAPSATPPPAASAAQSASTPPSASAAPAAPSAPRRREVAPACVGASFDLRALFEAPGPCASRESRGDLSAEDARALTWHLAVVAPKRRAAAKPGVVEVRAGERVDFELAVQNDSDHPIELVLLRPCNGLPPITLALAPPPNTFGLGETLVRDDGAIACDSRHVVGEAIELVLAPGGRARLAGKLRVMLDPAPPKRDKYDLPVGPEPRPRPLSRGSHVLLLNPGAFVPMDLDALPKPRPRVAEPRLMAWYPRVVEALEVR